MTAKRVELYADIRRRGRGYEIIFMRYGYFDAPSWRVASDLSLDSAHLFVRNVITLESEERARELLWEMCREQWVAASLSNERLSFFHAVSAQLRIGDKLDVRRGEE